MALPLQPTPWQIREAGPADIAGMHQVRIAVHENKLSDPTRITPGDYAMYLHELGKGWLCEIDQTIVGFAIADLAGESIWALFVDPAHEGKGIGKALHDTMLNWYFSKGKETVWLTTAPGTRAANFYRLQGWTEEGMKGMELKFTLTKNKWLHRQFV